MGVLSKNRDKHHNASQANFRSRGDGFGSENMRDYQVSQPSGGSFSGTTRINSAFGLGGGPISVNLTIRVNPNKQESQRAQLQRYFLGCVS